ncbi:MAG: ABC-F type ribosomal protection protein [Oscillospiraceae bacterium]|nr:ABC-F type ribosomal protection protein [Oscillospiraceae bacterium]
MSLINVSNLTFCYDGSYDNIFTDVSFQIDTDWKLGFCGRNGRGKTTFLKLLMGEYEYSGTISASVDFEYFPFNVKDSSQNTNAILLEIAPNAESWQILTELSMLAIPEEVLNRAFSTLSNGEQTKILLAALFLRLNSFLLIDEPTNHLDMAGREIVSKYLNSKRGFILVSHDRAFLDDCIDHILSINKTNIEIQNGNFSSWYHNKQMQDGFEQAENARLRKDIKRLETAARQASQWADRAESSKMGKGAAADRKKGNYGKGTKEYKAEKSRKMQARRKNYDNRQQTAIEEKSGLLKNVEEADSLKIHPLKYHANTLLYLENIAINYGNNDVINNVSFAVNQGDRLALTGKNGSGKSSILKLINGENIPHTGQINIGSRLVISFVSQDSSFLTGDLSAFAQNHDIDESLFKAILRKLDFSRVQFEKDMKNFSAGQRKKVLLARSLCQQAHIYIWDEPLNYIDVLSRMQIEELIINHKPTMIFVEHDRVFCDNIATKSISLK